MRQLTIVLAQWCPHCVPLSLEKAKLASTELNLPLRILDIDDQEQEKTADELVRKNGDYAEDYLIPQVFLEEENGDVRHILTGFSEAVPVTEARWVDLMKSQFYQQLRNQHK
jgi:glutaredoxin